MKLVSLPFFLINTKEELKKMDSITKQMLGSIVRAIFIFIGGLLVSRDVLSQQTLDVLANSLVVYIVSIVMVVAPLVVSYFSKQKAAEIHNQTIKEAVNAAPGTPISVVKQRVLDKIQGGI